MNSNLGEISLGRFATDAAFNRANRPFERLEQRGAASEWSPSLPSSRRSRREAPESNQSPDLANVYPFLPYLMLIRAALREGNINAAKKLLALALDQGGAEPDELYRLQQLLGPARVKRSAARGVNRAPEFQWLRSHGEGYRGQWVAVSGNQLVAHAPRLKDLLDEIKGLQLDRQPLIHKIS